MELISPLRTLLFLELMKKHPEKRGVLNLNSSYLPHVMFRDVVYPKSPKQITREIEKGIAVTLPSLYSEQLQRIICGIDEFVQHGNYPEKLRKEGYQRLGKYTLCQGFRFKEGANVDALTELLGNQEIKKDIFYGLAESFIQSSYNKIFLFDVTTDNKVRLYENGFVEKNVIVKFGLQFS